MNKKIFNFFEIAAKTALSKGNNRNFYLGAVAIRNDGVIVKSLNGPTDHPNREVHAEYKISKKVDHGAIVYVARIRLDNGQFGCAKPCNMCMKALEHRKVKKVYYTIAKNEFGIIHF